MPFEDVLEGSKRKAAMQDTWGHTFPPEKSKHPGHIVVAYTEHSETMVLHYAFDLCCSPQLYSLVNSVLFHKIVDDLEVGIYRIDCTLWFSKGLEEGRIIKCKRKKILDFEEIECWKKQDDVCRDCQ